MDFRIFKRFLDKKLREMSLTGLFGHKIGQENLEIYEILSHFGHKISEIAQK